MYIAGYGALLIFDLNLMKFSFERPLPQMKLPKQSGPKMGKIVQYMIIMTLRV